jgi:hypothetical protein
VLALVLLALALALAFMLQHAYVCSQGSLTESVKLSIISTYHAIARACIRSCSLGIVQEGFTLKRIHALLQREAVITTEPV